MNQLKYKVTSGYGTATDFSTLQYFYTLFSPYFFLFCWSESEGKEITLKNILTL